MGWAAGRADTLSACDGSIIVAISHTHRKLVWEGVRQVDSRGRWLRFEGVLGDRHCEDKPNWPCSLVVTGLMSSSAMPTPRKYVRFNVGPPNTPPLLLHNICRISCRD
jgi:hypothetical protein